MVQYGVIIACFALFASSYAETCSQPKVTSNSFTTQDATIVSNIAYIAEFEVECTSGGLTNLYAEVDGNVVPVSSTGQNKYQVSWTEVNASAKRGDRNIRIFDEDGYTAVRKALRNGEEISGITELFGVTINHPGAFNGPWLKSEFLAATLSLLVAYIAFSSRSKLLS
ncbi:translocon-associated protein subunit delta [Onthophagus taurus]|uniref:translocon-associated protein subunit delta n=1 Tax=Onthophagus taurus TaxID=166361 RepID=UPI000C208B69|nr:translocon-associated protein subunit delta [Onthophagus taurus]